MNGDSQFQRFRDEQSQRGIDIDEVLELLLRQKVETPSWGYGNSGTRFGVFKQPGAARDIHERLEDAAHVHRLTGICPSVAVHIPWDRVENYADLRAEAESLGIRIGAINPNVFQDHNYRFGSFGNVDASIRRKALDDVLGCVDVMKQTGSKVLSLWFADGTNYPGQDDFRRRKRCFEECFAEVYKAMPDDGLMLIEYKPFEPAFYHTDIADWGMAHSFCRKLGPRAKVLIDLGHHLHGANIEHIVAFLLDEDSMGGFHFNNRKYADDDLTTGSTNPYEVFLIYNEIVAGKAYDLEFMIDQCSNLKPPIESLITTVTFLQETFARALLVDRKSLAEARMNNDMVLAERCLQDAFTTDVRPLVAHVRERMGCSADPLLAHRQSGYLAKIAKTREGKKAGAGGWA